ncbi:hypothetical protein SO694_00041274 [Aureococcus anophagefferens]|uniref:Uncharacterized protein n=1 Tax=Aureococcus anophagefferens TaxID=44056 RepID=A0ABR1G673_AURAN
MVTASGERIVGKAISADSPAFFHVAHAEVNPELGRRLKRSKGPPFVPGKDRIEAARRAAGLDPPGRLVLGPRSATMVRESLPKETYVDFCRQKFYERDPQPLVRVGRRLARRPAAASRRRRVR